MRRSPRSGHDRGSVSLPDTKASARARVHNRQPPSSSGLRGSLLDSQHMCRQGLPRDQSASTRPQLQVRQDHAHKEPWPSPHPGALCAHWTWSLSSTVPGSLD